MPGFWARLFGRSKPLRTDEPVSEKVAAVIAEIEARVRPCLRLVPGTGGKSRLGGSPEMAGAWPWRGKQPLSLVAQLDLAEMRAAGGPDWLPDEGRLLFFYDADECPWGFDPKDSGAALVIHEVGPAQSVAAPDDLDDDFRFDAYPVRFVADTSFPSEERLKVDWKTFSQDELADLEAAVEAMMPQEPAHQVGGYAWAVQNDTMEWECQLVTNGLYSGDPDAWKTEGAQALEAGAEDWRLLLQIDSDEDAAMAWGDAGKLYFWIREQDARAGEFSRVWAIIQCC